MLNQLMKIRKEITSFQKFYADILRELGQGKSLTPIQNDLLASLLRCELGHIRADAMLESFARDGELSRAA